MAAKSDIEGEFNRLSGSMIAGSEEDFDVVCDFCIIKGIRAEAVAFCTTCNEHLCIKCKQNHNLTKLTFNHVILDGLSASVNTPGGSQVGSIDDLTNVLQELKELIKRLETSKTQSKLYQKQTEKSYYQMVDKIKQFKQTIIHHLDKLECELLTQAASLQKDKMDCLSSQIPACDIRINEIKQLKSKMVKRRGQKQNSQVSIAIQSAQQKIQKWQTLAEKIISSLISSQFVFSPDSNMDAITAVTQLGTISVVDKSTATTPSSAPARTPEYFGGVFIKKINIKSSKENKGCCITGICVLEDGLMAVCDSDNTCVKLVTSAGEVTEMVIFQHSPWDITSVEDCKLAVTLPDANFIQLLKLKPSLALDQTLPLPGRNYTGITYSRVCCVPACLQILDISSGTVLRTIDTDKDDERLFVDPLYISVSNDNSLLYVSDYCSGKVVCLDQKGVVMATYKVHCPRGVAVDECDRVLVCSEDSSIDQLCARGSQVRKLLGEKDGIGIPQAAIIFNEQLYVGSWYSNDIQMYRLK